MTGRQVKKYLLDEIVMFFLFILNYFIYKTKTMTDREKSIYRRLMKPFIIGPCIEQSINSIALD